MSGSSTVLHLSFDLFDLHEMCRIERQGRIVAVALMRAETAIGHAFTTRFHGRRIPQLRKIPIVRAQVRDGIENLAARDGTLIVNDGAGAARPALKLGPAFKRSLRYQFVYVHIDGGF